MGIYVFISRHFNTLIRLDHIIMIRVHPTTDYLISFMDFHLEDRKNVEIFYEIQL